MVSRSRRSSRRSSHKRLPGRRIRFIYKRALQTGMTSSQIASRLSRVVRLYKKRVSKRVKCSHMSKYSPKYKTQCGSRRRGRGSRRSSRRRSRRS